MTARLRLTASTLFLFTHVLRGAAPAEVVDSSAIGFTVKNTVEIAAAANRMLNEQIGRLKTFIEIGSPERGEKK